MSKFIVFVRGYPLVNGYKQWHFFWDQELAVYVYKSKRFGPEEFNDVYAEAMAPYQRLGLKPEVKCIDSDGVAAPAPITTISVAKEVTLEEAEAVVQRLAPHRLKKKPGPRQEEPLAATG